MKRLPCQNLLFVLSHERKRSHFQFHTKVHFIRQLQNCSDLTATSTHSNIVKFGFLNDTFTANHLINCYVRHHRISSSHQLLDEMPEPNVVSWTSVIAGYVNAGQLGTALELFGKMNEGSVMPNEFTFATVINACSNLSNLKDGRILHAQVEIMGFRDNLVVCTSLIDMYGKCNDVDGARQVFDSMRCKNVVSWTSMMVAYTQNARGHLALELLRKYNSLMSDHPNHFMLTSVISACASLGRLVSGKVAHGFVIRHGHDSNVVVESALIDMYSKSGCIEYSDKVFKKSQNPSVIHYTSMIASMAKYGLGKTALELFDEMMDKRLKPNHITLLGVLHACSHSGLVDEGLKHLKSMYEVHGVMPDVKHYTCVVDMLARSSRLDEAYGLAKSTKVVKPDEGALMWGTLLSASRVYGRVDIVAEASKKLIDSNQQVSSAYVTLSNTYALVGDLENAHKVRAEMKHAGVYKEPGCSWIEIRDSTYVFYARDVVSCTRASEVVSMLSELEGKMKEKGYVGGTRLVSIDVEEEAKEEIVGLHSERLALAFGLISIPKGITIRIMKNLRMCDDCHEAFKMISEIVERDFVVRDVNRFHHFKGGSCTCRDFW